MNNSEITIYKTEEGRTEIQVKLENDTVWLNQYQLEELFETNRTSIVKHIRNIYNTKELQEDSTCAFFAQVQTEGIRKITRNIKYYNLDLIISVGYRINSKRGTQFRIWANKILKDYLIKGYSINEKRLLQQNEQLHQLQESVKLSGRTYFFNSQLTPSFPSLISKPMAASSLRILSEVVQSLLALASARSFISKSTTSFKTSLFPEPD